MKKIDIYLIAGQSNAAGCTKVRDAEAIYAAVPELRQGFDHVLYAGNARSDASQYTVLENRDVPWSPARLGLGIRNDGYMGPEAGMAVSLSKIYNESTHRYAGLIKFAHGGTSLLEKRVSSNSFGNWVPPSYAKELNIPWQGDPITGELYRLLLAQIERNVKELIAAGFDRIDVKGLYWMQGCNNRTLPREYRRAFRFFADDIRRDVTALMEKLTGVPWGTAGMPIFVGTLSQTFSLNDENTEKAVNIPFIEMQRSLGKEIENCYTVDNSAYAITRWHTCPEDREILGTDPWHWNQTDALEIGKNVGKMMLEKCVQ
ncbi:MAG: hypothetical protein IJX39_01705 [Clostridia bacterium]|nr:hypothetical protein [Clostridia bacterium]